MISKRLKHGDTIGIVSPSKNLNDERKAKLQSAIEVLGHDFDLRVKLGKHVYAVDKYGCSATNARTLPCPSAARAKWMRRYYRSRSLNRAFSKTQNPVLQYGGCG